MIVSKFIEKKVTQYNLRIFKKFGFSIGEQAIISVKDLDRNSHEKVLVKCDICGIEKHNKYRQYMDSYEKYKIYCCSSKCSSFKNKNTYLIKYGYENYYNVEKYKQTCLDKYGVDNVFKIYDIILKIDYIKRYKYGYNLEKIIEKMRITMLDRYGVDNISKLEHVKINKKNKMIKSGFWYNPNYDNYLKYRYKVDYLTRKNIKFVLDKWDGIDYYDGEYIRDYYELDKNSILYPTIDHKISVKSGFIKNMSIEEMSSIDNLCITKRTINSKKNSKNEEDFIL